MKDNLRLLKIILTILALLWAVGGKMLLDRLGNIEKEMSLARQQTMAIAISAAETNTRTEYIERQIEEIKEKLDR